MKTMIINEKKSRSIPLNVGGFMINILASAEATKGFEIFHMAGAEGKGPGPHFHPWDESFYVLKGEVNCGVGETETLAHEGDFIFVPANTTHWFKFTALGGEMISITSHGNASKMFMAFDQGINWQSTEKSDLVKLAAEYGQTVL
jgi:quercetin dioxygenase-like cupin family protein